MNRFLSLLFALFITRAVSVFAGTGDTAIVQTFTFGSPQDARFLFPDSTHRWSKILMYYTLKCNPAQSPACGEWDYQTSTYYYRHTGQFDSTQYSHPNFMLNGTTPDTLMFMNTPSWSYIPRFEYFNQTFPLDTAFIGAGNLPSQPPLCGSAKDARTQILWRKDELLAAGLKQGDITGLRFNFQSVGGVLKRLMIRMMQTTADSLSAGQFEEGNFTVVFDRDHRFPQSGWQALPFTYPFSWDGTSNLLVDISYEDQGSLDPNIVLGDDPGFPAVQTSCQPDFTLKFRDYDFVRVPASAFAQIDSSITVSFWIYGDPQKQPQDNTVFEGIDSAGQRVINVHLPWSNGTIYWDAGRDSSGYDRLYQHVNDASLYRGKWNHWTFTKDVKSGKMKIYYNGKTWRIASSKSKRMNGIAEFRIGSQGDGNGLYYDGMIDEFCVWNKALSDTAIREFLYKDITPAHPLYEDLAVCYHFNDGSGFETTGAGPGNHNATLKGYPDWQSYQGKERFRNVEPATVRPAVAFEQGIYDPSALDSLLKIDTLQKSPIMIILYGDSLHPYLPTDTLTKWPSYYASFVFNAQGQATDSTLVPPDGFLFRKDNIYYGEPFEILKRFELGRYITPYGINLSLGSGWTWIYDLTDYAPLLHDSVHLTAGNWQELLDVKFIMIEGIPPRDVIAVKNIYTGNHGYADESQHNLPPVKVKIGENVANARLKMRITGHGFGGTLNCSEFCPRNNMLFINENLAYTHYIWRKCGINPLYPQGGTWLYDRAQWCPGAEVSTMDFELSPFLVPGDSLTIDYDLQPGYTWDGQGSWPYYQIESQLITYTEPNYSINVSLEEILSPNSTPNYNRFNPMCGSPEIIIKNNGKYPLTSVDVYYAPSGGINQAYHWTGNLPFQDTTHIILPPYIWNEWSGGDNRFTFTLADPNGGNDEDPGDNSMTSSFTIPPTYDNMLQFHFHTNHMAHSLSWKVEDQSGNLVFQNGELENNTLYTDTLKLSKGCYRLTISNSEGEGLSYWANMPPYGNGTAGYAKILDMEGKIVKSFQGDFGSNIAQSFTIGMTIDVPDLHPEGYVKVFPNPSDGNFYVGVVNEIPVDLEITVANSLGKKIFYQPFGSVTSATIPVSIKGCSPGVYFVSVSSARGILTGKLLIY
jgi:hypothetical protein